VLLAAGLWMPAAAAVTQAELVREVRHHLVLLPYYGIFDNLEFKVDANGRVTLLGQVRNPTLKDDAGRVVQSISGVHGVTNNIEVLPLSPNDDRIRQETYRAVYSFPSLQKYAIMAVPSIHIIVKNGHITLTGIVDNQSDKDAAGLRANGVPGAFSVQNDLRAASQQER
jgi:hyperosmotically inducible protein